MGLATDIIGSGFKPGPQAQAEAQMSATDVAASHIVLAARLLEAHGTISEADLTERLTPALAELSAVVKHGVEMTRRAALLKAKVAETQAARAPTASVIQRGEDNTADLLRQSQGL